MEDKKYNLLIIDDEIMVIRSIMRALDNTSSNIFYTTDPTKMIDILDKTPIDIIISDQRMPEMTGLELLMKAKEVCPSAIRILMSGYSDIDIVIAAINEGRIFQYISKPWDNDKLVETINNAIMLKTEEDEKAAILTYRLENIENWNTVIADMSSEMGKKGDSTVNALLKVLKAKDFNLYKHSVYVSMTAVLLADELGFSKEQKEAVRYAGLLHDIGKIAIRDKIMYKAGSLDEDEYEEMKNHPTVGAEILREVDFLGTIADIVEQHHERIDGKGYPKGISFDMILKEAQIISVADNFEALREDRVYRAGMNAQEALKIIIGDNEKKFNPDVTDMLIKALYSDTSNCVNTKYSIE